MKIKIIISVLALVGQLTTYKANAQPNAAKMTEDEVVLILAERCDKGVVYIDKFVKMAKRMRAKYNFPVSLTLAIALLESNGTNSELAQKTGNLYGICCSFDWEGPTYSMPHDQYDDETGKWITAWTCFRVYPNGPEESMADFFSFILSEGRPWYSDAWQCNMRVDCWIQGLSEFATDPAWGDKLKEVIERYHLAVFDKNHGS